MPRNIKNKVGNIFPPALVILGYFTILFGVIIIINFIFCEILDLSGMSLFGSIFQLLIGVFLAFTSVWIEIDIERNMYKRYTNYFGFIKSGKWKSLERYTDLAILKIKEAVEYASRSNRTTKQSKNVYNVCLLDSTHRLRIVLYKAEKFVEAEKYAKNIMTKLDVKYTQYNPKISEKTRLRRKR